MSKISKITIYQVLHDTLRMNEISEKWVTLLLSALKREHRFEWFRTILNMCGDDPKQLSIVTRDETMILFYDALSLGESRTR